MSEFKNLKFKVDSEEEYKILQRILCDLEYDTYSLPSQNIQKYIFCYSSGVVGCGSIDYYYFRHENTEVDTSFLKALLPKVERKVVSIGGVSYYEDELAEALSNIKPV